MAMPRDAMQRARENENVRIRSFQNLHSPSAGQLGAEAGREKLLPTTNSEARQRAVAAAAGHVQ